jgi:pseudouridine kinase
MNNKIFCIGGAALDRKLQSFAPLVHCSSNPVTANAYFGGVARNVAENLVHWTHGVSLHTVVGEDDDGIQMLSTLKQKGVDITHSIILKNARTANYYAVLDEKGELYLSLADMTIFDQIPMNRFIQGFNVWEPSSILFMDTNLPADIIETVIRIANEKNMYLFVDPVSVVKAKKLPVNLHGIFLLKPNPIEASTMAGMTVETVGDAMDAGQRLCQRGAKNVIITLGKAGYVIVNNDLCEFIGIEAIHDIINVNGAGDAFMAGIIYGMQQNHSIQHACQWGAAAAAFTVSSPDTVALGITSSQLQAFIHNQKIITGQHYMELA